MNFTPFAPPPFPPPSRPPTLQEFQQATACKYTAAAGLAFLLYDHIISFSDEVELVWKAKWTFAKAIFLLLRYAVPCAFIVHNYQLAGLNLVQKPNSFCQVWFNIMVCLGMMTVAIGNFLVLLRLWLLRNRNRRFIFFTLILFVIANLASIACVVIVLVNVNSSMMYDPGLRMCVMAHRGLIGLLFAPAVIFDGIALVATLWNALGRPRCQQMSLMQYLRQDGFIFVLLLFLMRAINFFTSLFGPLHIIFLTIYIIWATTTVTVSWLVLDLRRNGRSAKDTELDPE